MRLPALAAGSLDLDCAILAAARTLTQTDTYGTHGRRRSRPTAHLLRRALVRPPTDATAEPPAARFASGRMPLPAAGHEAGRARICESNR